MPTFVGRFLFIAITKQTVSRCDRYLGLYELTVTIIENDYLVTYEPAQVDT